MPTTGQNKQAMEFIRFILKQEWPTQHQRTEFKKALKMLERHHQMELDARKVVVPSEVESLDDIVEKITDDRHEEI